MASIFVSKKNHGYLIKMKYLNQVSEVEVSITVANKRNEQSEMINRYDQGSVMCNNWVK